MDSHVKMSEDEISQRCMLAGSEANVVLMRNNRGAFEDKKSKRWIFFGLAHVRPDKKKEPGWRSVDYIFIKPTLITPEMVGRTIGVFGCVEMKEEGWKFNPKDDREQGQLNFINWVLKRGGIAGFVNSIDSFKKLLRSL